jgi:hypothetical protein
VSADAREFAEAASMAMQHRSRPYTEGMPGPAPKIETLALLSLAYSMIEIAENLTRLIDLEATEEPELS